MGWIITDGHLLPGGGYIRGPSTKERTFVHTVRAPVLLHPIIGFWCSVGYSKVCHALVRRTLSLSTFRDSCGQGCSMTIENPADCEVRGVISFLQADEILGYLAEEANSPVKLFCCTSHTAQQTQALVREQFH